MQLSLSLNPAPKCSYQPRTKKSYERLVSTVITRSRKSRKTATGAKNMKSDDSKVGVHNTVAEQMQPGATGRDGAK
uniref:Uncharacterized protein n=1 Tax=Pristionchus pacificus TaxID=54126 RepID=A0A2A6CKR8_PRIPA|eukprot:PDM78688.1 hypothetical protein PRIPAC_31267 [Pristionchus pacificus]